MCRKAYILKITFLLFLCINFQFATANDTVIVVPGTEYSKSFIHKLFFGFHYRDIWKKPVKVPVFDLSNQGFSVVKVGGSRESRTLHLLDGSNREYVARSVNKDLSKALPAPLQKTFLSTIMKDQVSANHPYAPLVVARLAGQLQIYHCTPKLYVLNVDSFSPYAVEFNGLPVMIEEKAGVGWKNDSLFGMSDNVISTEKLLDERMTEGVLINANEYLKNRLLDILIGDWSRHEDQFRWIWLNENYIPVPRDRDHAFYKFNDGILNKMATLVNPRYLTFSKKIKRIKHLTATGKPLDDLILPSLTSDEWSEVTQSTISQLTDFSIDEAVAELPDEISHENTSSLRSNLKSRRDRLGKASKKFYSLVIKRPEIIGTNKSDVFKITRVSSTETKVQIFKTPITEEDDAFFSRSFYTNETKEIKILGLEGDDEFQIFGNSRKGIKINLVGGPGVNTLQNFSTDKEEKKGLNFNPKDALSFSQVVMKFNIR